MLVSRSQTFRLTAEGLEVWEREWPRPAQEAIWLTGKAGNHVLYCVASRFGVWKCRHNNRPVCKTLGHILKILCRELTFMHLADAFIQSDLQLHSGYTFLLVHVFPGNRTHNLSLSWRNVLPLSHTGILNILTHTFDYSAFSWSWQAFEPAFLS